MNLRDQYLELMRLHVRVCEAELRMITDAKVDADTRAALRRGVGDSRRRQDHANGAHPKLHARMERPKDGEILPPKAMDRDRGPKRKPVVIEADYTARMR